MICPKLYFSTLDDSLFSFELIMDWNVPNPLWNNLSYFNLSDERIKHFIIFTYCLYFSFLFSVPCNFCPWWHCGNSHHAHGLFPNILPKLSFWVFNLARFLCLNFCLGCPLGFSTKQAFHFFYFFFKCCISRACSCWSDKASLFHPNL